MKKKFVTLGTPNTLPGVGPVTHLVEVLQPSGRFDALVDMGNPMKGIGLFPYLKRRVEGRSLKAMGPVSALELSRTVCEVVLPRRWPREVCYPYKDEVLIFRVLFFDVCLLFFVFQVQGEWQRAVGSRGDQPGQFNMPRGLALSPDEAFLLVLDAGNDRVAVLRATDGAWVRQLTGPPGTFSCPTRVVVASSGEVLVSDIRRHQVVRFRSINDDTVVGTLGTGQGSGPSQLIYPYGFVVLDSPVCCFRLFFNCVISFFLPSLRFHS